MPKRRFPFWNLFPKEAEVMSVDSSVTAQFFLQRILDLQGSGCTREEISRKFFSPDAETTHFRLSMLVEIVLNLAPMPPGNEKGGRSRAIGLGGAPP